jgi:hypothetical protein
MRKTIGATKSVKTQCPGYNRATLVLGDINPGTWSPGWGSLKSETVKCILYIVHCKRQTRPLVREGAAYQKPAMV